MAKRMGLGSKQSNSSTINEALSNLSEMDKTTAYINKHSRQSLFVGPEEIIKDFNARFIPCSFKEFQAVDWPSLDIDSEAAKPFLLCELQKHEWYLNLSEVKRAAFLKFMEEVHETAQSIYSQTQYQPILLESKLGKDGYFLVDGERRTLSCFYSKGLIPLLKAELFEVSLSQLERALAKDMANSSVKLKPNELIISKQAIYNASPDIAEKGARGAAKILGVGKTKAAELINVFTHPEKEKILSRIENEDLEWKDIRFLLKNGAGAKIESKKVDPPLASPTPKRAEKRDPNLAWAENTISERVGFPCEIASKGKKGVSLSFSCSDNEQLDCLLTKLGIELEK